jgi:hypothetical protein
MMCFRSSDGSSIEVEDGVEDGVEDIVTRHGVEWFE